MSKKSKKINPIVIQDSTYSWITYNCYAKKGTSGGEAKWKIIRETTSCTIPSNYGKTTNISITNIGSGKGSISEAPNGDYGYNYILNNITTYTYWR